MVSTTDGGTEFDPVALERAARRGRTDLWDAAPAALAARHGIERRDFGPIQATIGAPEMGRDTSLLLGAAGPGAADEGFLAEAVGWCREREAKVYVPLVPGQLGFDAAQGWLERNGFEPSGGRRRFVRDAHPPRFPEPEDVQVSAVEGDDGASFGSWATFGAAHPGWVAGLLAALPGRPGWRCYLAHPAHGTSAAGAVFADGSIAIVALASSWDAVADHTRSGLLHRIIVDAAAAGASTIAAQIDEPADGPPRSAAAGLLLAGFEAAYRCPGWSDARLPAG
jgi:hypothetical protein